MTANLVQRVLEADNLPSLPSVALEVLTLTRREDVSVDALARAVQNDPALTAKILKMVNSSLFGLAREVGSIRQAMVILGLRTVKVMALSFALVDSLRKGGEAGLDVVLYWRRSLTTAVGARLLGRIVVPRQAEEAFVAGLLSDLGLFAAWRCASELYAPVFAEARGTGPRLCDVEQRVLGVTHADLSLELLKKWNLPEPICSAVGAHHGKGIEGLHGDVRRLALTVRTAATIADAFCGDRPVESLEEARGLCGAELGIDSNRFDGALASLDGYVKETASLLSLDVGTTMNYAQLQAEAAMQLATIGLEAEMARTAAARREQEARQESARLQQEKTAILEAASTDGLTKIANRTAFDRRLSEELARAASLGGALGLILLDVDHFKSFNDTYGHPAGDEVLRSVAACLHRVANHAGLVARYGGEEFAVICLSHAAAQVRELAERIRAEIAALGVAYDHRLLHVTASLGVSHADLRRGSTTPQALVESADRGLYAAKRRGRNRVETAG